MSDSRDRTTLAILAAAATGIQVGAAITATRFAVDMVGPASLALRHAIGAACLAPVLLSGRMRFARDDILPIALLGIGQFGVLIALLNFGLKSVPSARAALIFATFPMLTLLFAALVGQERLTVAKTAGVALTILGVGFALGDKTLSSAQSWTGELAVLASALVGAVCSVLCRPYLKRYPALPVSAFAMLAAVLALAVPAALDDLFTAVPRLNAAGWAAVVFIGLSSGGGYVLWLWALANTSATRVTVFLSLSPITAAVLGALLLGEPVSATMLAGLACVMAGLWLANREPGISS